MDSKAVQSCVLIFVDCGKSDVNCMKFEIFLSEFMVENASNGTERPDMGSNDSVFVSEKVSSNGASKENSESSKYVELKFEFVGDGTDMVESEPNVGALDREGFSK